LSVRPLVLMDLEVLNQSRAKLRSTRNASAWRCAASWGATAYINVANFYFILLAV